MKNCLTIWGKYTIEKYGDCGVWRLVYHEFVSGDNTYQDEFGSSVELDRVDIGNLIKLLQHALEQAEEVLEG